MDTDTETEVSDQDVPQIEEAAPQNMFQNDVNVFLFTSFNMSILLFAFFGGYFTREQFVLCTSTILIVTRVIYIIRPDCGILEKLFFFLSHLLTLPALVGRNAFLMLNAMNVLMFGRLVLFGVLFYKGLLARTPFTASFITMAINNEGMLWSLRVLFRIAVAQTPEASDSMRAIANETLYF